MKDDVKARGLRFMRFGLAVSVGVAFAVTLTVFYIVLAPLGALDLVIFWTLVITVITAIISVIVYYAYKVLMERGS